MRRMARSHVPCPFAAKNPHRWLRSAAVVSNRFPNEKNPTTVASSAICALSSIYVFIHLPLVKVCQPCSSHMEGPTLVPPEAIASSSNDCGSENPMINNKTVLLGPSLKKMNIVQSLQIKFLAGRIALMPATQLITHRQNIGIPGNTPYPIPSLSGPFI